MSKLLIILSLWCLMACTAADRQPAIPRPKAYPRPTLYAADYKTCPISGSAMEISVNKSAEVVSTKPGWFDICYPAYDITVNCTLTPITPESLSSVLDNRHERMALNLEGQYGEMTQWDGVTIIVAPAAMRTPVQFLATDSASFVLSGVAVGNYPAGASPDSIAPYVNAVAQDITHMLKQL